MYQALYRKYRPKTLDDVVGQNVIKKTLTNSILNDKISHAYLFTGPRGTGKTSIAKILAKIVNCSELEGITPCNKCVSCTQILNKQNTDIIEIDAASNNGVDEIREIREKVTLVPSFGKYKVYIIDEVHMLTTAAFNALLKTLEEPPKHIIFILATTEPHKIPNTILSRCQRFDFQKISEEDIVKKLTQISQIENIDVEEDTIKLIAYLSDGGMRDSLSLFDQLTSYTSNKITIEDVNEVYGSLTKKEINDFLILIVEKKVKEIFERINKYNSDGKNLIKIMELIIDFLKNCLICFNCSDYFVDSNEKEIYNLFCSIIDEIKIYNMIDIFIDSVKSSKNTNNSKLVFELAIIKLLKLDKTTQEEKKENLEIYEEPKKIITVPKIETKKISDKVLNKIEEIKKIRINNALALFNKKDLVSFKEKFELINELLMDPKYSSMISLLLDGEIKVKGGEYIIFVYDSTNLDNYFNSNLLDIQKILYEKLNEVLKPIAIPLEVWEIIKKEFNNNLKQNKKIYEYKEENYDLEEIYSIKETKEEIKNNDIEELFEEIVVYN